MLLSLFVMGAIASPQYDEYDLSPGYCKMSDDDREGEGPLYWLGMDGHQSDSDMCHENCNSEPLCTGFEINKDGGGQCHLIVDQEEYEGNGSEVFPYNKFNCYRKKKQPHRKGYEKMGKGICMGPDDINWGRLKVWHLSNGTPKSCQRLCDDVDNCQGYNLADNKDCLLWMEGPITQAHPNSSDKGTCRRKVHYEQPEDTWWRNVLVNKNETYFGGFVFVLVAGTIVWGLTRTKAALSVTDDAQSALLA